MTSPSPNDSSCLWFRRTFVTANYTERPVRASVCIVSASRFVLYVNGRNVSTSLYSNASGANAAAPVSTTYDVTRFLRPDSNTVAVLACPIYAYDGLVSSPKIAISLYGTTATGNPFASSSADGWLCHAASTVISAGNELEDGRSDALPPSHGDMVMAQWQPVEIIPPSTYYPQTFYSYNSLSAESIFGHTPLGYNTLTDNSAYTRHTLLPRFFDIDGSTVTYDFSPGFYGLVRVTFRGCRRGERIHIGNHLAYICSGEMDEQAYCRFSPIFARKITISGDRWFHAEQVQEVVVLGL